MTRLLFVLLFVISSNLLAQQNLNMTLLSKLEYPSGLNDVWGYVDDIGNEYAIVGLVNGTSFVDVSDPYNPIEKAFIPGPTSIWRDMKTWGDYAYIVHDQISLGESQGLLIVNLKELSSGNIDYTSFYFDELLTAVHNLYIDENGVLYLFGGNYGVGGAIIFDVNTNPEEPIYLGEFQDYYLHDGMVRGDTLWGAAVYEGVLAAIDVSDKSSPIILGSISTPSTFTHNTWVSDDGNTVYTTDEVQGAYITAIDVSDIQNLQVIDTIQSWSTETNVIPHNTHVIGNYLVTSYYCDGVTIVDASDPYNMQEVAYYDTSDSTGGTFSGAWGAYPWLPSGNILVSDRQEGLHILSVDNIEFSVSDVDSFIEVDISPNPASNTFNVAFENDSWTSIEVFNILGHKVFSKANQDKLMSISLGEFWPSGIYLMKVIEDNETKQTYRLVKE